MKQRLVHFPVILKIVPEISFAGKNHNDRFCAEGLHLAVKGFKYQDRDSECFRVFVVLAILYGVVSGNIFIQQNFSKTDKRNPVERAVFIEGLEIKIIAAELQKSFPITCQ